ncbi:hypothetical protein C8R45DRAFT_1135949 [Mycena sanguinolenta]|nr:hypothetical protein C8R45DRAFT_1135949 [Mycena sanguinolenta]
MSEIGKRTIPLFVGTVTNWALLGVLAVQVYIYYLAFPNDRRSTKSVVAFVCIAEILQTLADSRNAICVFGVGWGNPEILNEVGWAWFSVPILGSIIASVGQIFFAWRISVIGKSLHVPILIALVSAFQMGAGIWTGVDIVRAKEFSRFRLFKPPEAWLSAMAAADLIIVAGTVFYLLKAQEPDFRRKMKATLSQIIRITVETGVLCAMCAVVDLYLFVAFDGNNYHLGMCLWLSKAYSNSILVVLNSRAHISHHTARNDMDQMSQVTEIVFGRSQGLTSAVRVSIDIQTRHSDNQHGKVTPNSHMHSNVETLEDGVNNVEKIA